MKTVEGKDTMILGPDLLNTASAVWRFLQNEGGIDLKHYDQALELELFGILQRMALRPEAVDLDSLLANEAVTVEDFLVAFFRAVQPFSDMMSDLLRLFENAGIKCGKENMDVRFNFDKMSSPLDFDLSHFRQWQETWQRIAGTFLVNLWTCQDLWKVNDAVRQMDARIRNPRMRDWLGQYRGTTVQPARFPNVEPAAPRCGLSELDAAFERVWSLWLRVVRESKRYGPEREKLSRDWRKASNREGLAVPECEDSRAQYPSEQYRELWPLELLGILNSDLWAASLAEGLYAKAEQIQDLAEPMRSSEASALKEKLSDIFSALHVVEFSDEQLRQKLVDFLRLPVWKRRHELYSAWIMTQIVAALDAEQVEIHSAHGRLLFEFKPTHMATVTSRQPQVHLMAEVRSPLSAPLGKGRKGSIQPDYSLIPSPVTSSEGSLMEIECKQYLQASKRGFANALSDYARGRPGALVVLVNYGPAGDGILDKVDPKVRVRTRVLGEMRPRSRAAQGDFVRFVQEAVSPCLSVRCAEQNSAEPCVAQKSGVVATIRLNWESAPADLDLHLVIDHDGLSTEIHHAAMGDGLSFPWAQLDRDDRVGNGCESIQIGKWLEGTYHCDVHNYSGDASLAGSGARLTLFFGGQELRFVSPLQGTGRWWKVFSYSRAEDRIEVINKVTEFRGE